MTDQLTSFQKILIAQFPILILNKGFKANMRNHTVIVEDKL